MLLHFLATFCIASATAYSVLDENYLVVESDAEELRWADSYTVKATKISLTSNIVEDYTAWKTNQSSRVDYNNGAVKEITKLGSDLPAKLGSDLPAKLGSDLPAKFRIHPETTEETLNEIVCHFVDEVLLEDVIKLDEILPSVTKEELYEAVGNETIEEIYATKFVYHYIGREREMKKTIWATYNDYYGWVPIKFSFCGIVSAIISFITNLRFQERFPNNLYKRRHEVKEYNVRLGSLIGHVIWTFFDYDPEFADEDVFDTDQYGCEEKSGVKHTADSEKITKEMMFVDPDNEKHLDYVFNHFKNKFSRNYVQEKEHALRKAIFAGNIRMIASVNRRNLTYKLGVNQFSDWTPEEIKRSHGAIPRPEGKVGTVAFPYEESDLEDVIEKLPKQYDLRLLGLISPVKDQGTCGSCWTFAAAAVVEGGLARINGGKVLSLSNQAIMDCAYDGLGEDGAGGCNGGYDFTAYEFIMNHGLPTDQEYGPYKNQDGFCNIGNMTKTYAIIGYTDVMPNSFNAMKVAVVNHGPIYVYVHVSEEFQAYSGGIFYQTNKHCDPEDLDHTVALVGYGERYGELFWILKNSWGETWGIDGYMLVAAKDNVCGVSTHPSYPVF